MELTPKFSTSQVISRTIRILEESKCLDLDKTMKQLLLALEAMQPAIPLRWQWSVALAKVSKVP